MSKAGDLVRAVRADAAEAEREEAERRAAAEAEVRARMERDHALIERTPGGKIKQRRCPHCSQLTTKGNFEPDSIWRHVCPPAWLTKEAEESLAKRCAQAGDPDIDDPEPPSWAEVRSLLAEVYWARQMGTVLGWARVATTTGKQSDKCHLIVDQLIGSAYPACGISSRIFDGEIDQNVPVPLRCERCDRSPWGRDLAMDLRRKPHYGSREHAHYRRASGII